MPDLTQVSEAQYIYDRCVELCQDIKTCYGPEFLNATLRRHKDFNNFILDYQRQAIVDAENAIIDFMH